MTGPMLTTCTVCGGLHAHRCDPPKPLPASTDVVLGVTPAAHCGCCDQVFVLSQLDGDGLCVDCRVAGELADAKDEIKRLAEALHNVPEHLRVLGATENTVAEVRYLLDREQGIEVDQ